MQTNRWHKITVGTVLEKNKSRLTQLPIWRLTQMKGRGDSLRWFLRILLVQLPIFLGRTFFPYCLSILSGHKAFTLRSEWRGVQKLAQRMLAWASKLCLLSCIIKVIADSIFLDSFSSIPCSWEEANFFFLNRKLYFNNYWEKQRVFTLYVC